MGSGGVTLISPVGITSPICGSNPELVAGGKEGVIYGVCYSNQTGSTLQTIMGGLDGCGYSCSSPGSNQTNTACTQLPTSNGIAQCFQGVNAGENSSGTGVILQSPGIHGTEAFWAGTTASPLNYLYVGGVGTSSSQTRITAYLASTANGAFGTQGWLDNQPTDWTYPVLARSPRFPGTAVLQGAVYSGPSMTGAPTTEPGTDRAQPEPLLPQSPPCWRFIRPSRPQSMELRNLRTFGRAASVTPMLGPER